MPKSQVSCVWLCVTLNALGVHKGWEWRVQINSLHLCSFVASPELATKGHFAVCTLFIKMCCQNHTALQHQASLFLYVWFIYIRDTFLHKMYNRSSDKNSLEPLALWFVVDSKRFWRWSVTLGIAGFQDLLQLTWRFGKTVLKMECNTRDCWVSGLTRTNTTFRELDLFPSSGPLIEVSSF
jgi:hypothetical protein